MRTIVKQIVTSFFIFLLLASLLAGCAKFTGPEKIFIGVAWPFSENAELFNEGIDLAVKQINEDGGINGKECVLLKKDDESSVVKGMSIAENFIENKSVFAVIGHKDSFVSIPASKMYEEAGLVMLSPASTAPELTKDSHNYIFRTIPNDTVISRKIAEYLKQQEYHRIVIYYSPDSYATGLANSFEKEAGNQGITIVDRFDFYSNPEELRYLHERWQAFGYDGIFIAHSASAAAGCILDAEQLGINGPFFGGNALDSPLFIKKAGRAAEGTVIGSVFDPAGSRPEVKKFISHFQKQYNKMPGPYAALGYDAVKMIAAAIENGEALNRSAVAEELRNVNRWAGASGIHSIGKTGDDRGEMVVLKQLRNGIFVVSQK